MKGYAHPILDDDGEKTGEWCNAPEGEGEADKPDAEMTPDMWAMKDYLERWSIETQTAYKGVVELLVAKIILPDGELGKGAIDWASTHFKPSPPTQKPAPKPAESTQGTPDNEPRLTEAQAKKIYATSKEKGYKPDTCTSILALKFHIGTSKDLTRKQASEFIELLESGYGLDADWNEEKTEPEDLPY